MRKKSGLINIRITTLVGLFLLFAIPYTVQAQCSLPGTPFVPSTATYCSSESGANLVVQNAQVGYVHRVHKDGNIIASQTANSGFITFGPYTTGVYQVTVLNNCNQSVSVGTCTISIPSPPSGGTATPSRSLSEYFCDSNPGILSISAGSGSGYVWSIDGNVYSNGASLSYPFDHQAYGVPGTHSVAVNYNVNGGACYPNYPVTVSGMSVTIVANPVIAALNSGICTNQTATINVNATVLDPPTSALQLNWTVDQVNVTGASAGSGAGNPYSISQQLINNTNATGTATYHITPTVAGCVGNTIHPMVTVTPATAPTNAFVASASICPNTTTNVVVQNAGVGYQYSIYKGGLLETKTPDASGIINFGPFGEGVYEVYYNNTVCGTLVPVGTSTISLITTPPPSGTATPSRSLSEYFCDSNPGTLTITSGTSLSGYEWTIDNVPYNVGQGQVLTYPFAHEVYGVPGTHTVTVSYYVNGGSCYPNYRVTVGNMPVTIIANPVISASDKIICTNQTATVNVNAVVLDPPAAMLQLSWTVDNLNVTGASAGSGSGNPFSISQQLTNNTTGSGTSTYHITPTVAGCVGNTIHPKVTVKSASAPTNATVANATICPNTTTNVVVQNAGIMDEFGVAYQYSIYMAGGLLSTGSADASGMIFFGPYGEGVYNIFYNNTVCGTLVPVGTSTISLITTPPPSGTATPSRSLSTSFCDSDPGDLTITAGAITGTGVYQWNIDNTAYSEQGQMLTYPFDHPVFGIAGTHNVSVTYRVNGGTCYPDYAVTVSNMPVTITNPPAGVSLQPSGPLKICSYCTQELTASPTGTGYTYQWFKDGSPVGSNQPSYLASSNGVYSFTVTQQGCSAPSDPLTLTRNIIPVVAAGSNQVLVLPADETTLTGSASDADGTIATYLWSQLSGPAANMSNANTSNLTLTYLTANTYLFRFTATDDFGESAYGDVAVEVQEPPNNYNWVKETTVLEKNRKTETEVNALEIQTGQKSLSWNYFDGLGRAAQSISVQGSPAKKDIVQPVVYDQFGREEIKYLPFVSSGNNGWLKNNPVGTPGNYTGSDHQVFYTNTSDKIADDVMPFAKTVFEPSPLNRVLKQGSPGEAWQPDAVNTYSSADRTIKRSSELNGSNEVLRWTYTQPTATAPLGLVDAGTASTPMYFDAGQVYKNKSKDEQHHEVIEYTDKEGRTILKRVQAVEGAPAINDTNYASTYYIYDDFGNLVCVIPPEAVRTLADYYFQTDATEATKNDFLKRWAFRYRYDSRKRMIEKQVPGAEPVYMVYDNRDRLVMTQDGVQRTLNRWLFTKYDQLNRPVITGSHLADSTLTQEKMQRRVDVFYNNNGKYFESPKTDAGHVEGYTNLSYPSETNVVNLLTVTYYDNYNWKTILPDSTNFSFAVSELPGEQESAYFKRLRGQVTGMKVKALDGGIAGGRTWLRTVNYYDDRNRVIQTVSDNYKGGFDRATTVYDFSGKVIKTKLQHSEMNLLWNPTTYTEVIGNKIRKTTTTSAWDAEAISADQLAASTDGWVECVIGEENKNRGFGFNQQNTAVSYTDIDYAFVFLISNGPQVRIYENGVLKNTPGYYKTGDVFRIERAAGAVKYYWNGNMIYPSATPSTSPLYVEAAFNSEGGTLVVPRASFSGSAHAITRRFEYDHAGRLLKTWHRLDSEPEMLLANNSYNEVGQLIDKKLHSTVADASNAKQSVDYRYNIRGWLTSINNAALENNAITNDDAGDLFGMQLDYEQPVVGLTSGSDVQFNGNISAIRWSNNLGLDDLNQRGYKFDYDPLNRLEGATHKEKTNVWNASAAFHEDNLTYDLNGNIQSLNRKDKNGLPMDVLSYDYGTGAAKSNQLQFVTDTGNDLKGFTELNTLNADYVYDANGNLVWDKNKGGKDVLINGDFENGSVDWYTSGETSRITFGNGEVTITAGAQSATIGQNNVLAANKPYIVIIDMIQAQSVGKIVLKLGTSQLHASGTGKKVLITTSNGSNLSIIPTADFAGTIKSISIQGLTVIAYNHLNLPELVTRAGDKNLRYIYDATGRKLAQEVFDKTNKIVKRSDYAGEFFYENDTLKFINDEEGRIIVGNGGWQDSPQLLPNADCSNLSNFGAYNGTDISLSTYNNGDENYLRVQSNMPTNTPGVVTGLINVLPAQQYELKVKGYRGTGNVYLYVQKQDGGDLLWVGAALPSGSGNEAWVSSVFTVPAGHTQVRVGALWAPGVLNDAFYINKIELYKHDPVQGNKEYVAATYEYQYHLKDHLGNVRCTFTTKEKIDQYTATLEDIHIDDERSDFPNYDDVTTSGASAYNHTVEAGATRSVVLNGAPGKQVGLAKSMKVVPGDTIDIKVHAKYFKPGTTGGIGTAIATAVTGAFGLSSGSIGPELSAFQSLSGMFNTGWVLGLEDWEDANAPKAFLNYILFDEDFIPYDMGWDQISINANATAPHDLLTLQARARKPGYVYIYFSNEETSEIVEVYFDDFDIKHKHSPVIQADDYYPFGLTFNSYSRENSVPQKFLFQEKELQDELDLNVYDFDWRQYDPAIGRTTTQDPHADSYWDLSPYSFFANNPINTLDPTGMDTTKVNNLDMKTFKPEEDVVLLDEVVITPDENDDQEDTEENGASAATAAPLILSWEGVGTGVAVTVSAPVILLTTIFTLIPNSAGDGEMEALRRMQEDNLKGGKQGQRDKDFGIRDQDFWKWWHRKGKKEHGGRDLTGENAQEVYDDWVDLGKPKADK